MEQEPIVSGEICENLNQLMSFPREGMFTRVLTKSESFSCALICLTQRNDIYMHALSAKACIQVIKGEAVLRSLEGEQILRQGTFVYLPEHFAHSIEAREDTAFLLCLSHMLSREMYEMKRKAA